MAAACRIIPQEHAIQKHTNNAHAHFHPSFPFSLHMHPIYGPFYFISSNMHLSPTRRGIFLLSNLIPPSKSNTCCKTFLSTLDLKWCDTHFLDQCFLSLPFTYLTIFYLQWMQVFLLCLISLGWMKWMTVRWACFPPISFDIISSAFLKATLK